MRSEIQQKTSCELPVYLRKNKLFSSTSILCIRQSSLLRFTMSRCTQTFTYIGKTTASRSVYYIEKTNYQTQMYLCRYSLLIINSKCCEDALTWLLLSIVLPASGTTRTLSTIMHNGLSF